MSWLLIQKSHGVISGLLNSCPFRVRRLPILHVCCFLGFPLIWDRAFSFFRYLPCKLIIHSILGVLELSSLAFHKSFLLIVFEFCNDGPSFVLVLFAETVNLDKGNVLDKVAGQLSCDCMKFFISNSWLSADVSGMPEKMRLSRIERVWMSRMLSSVCFQQ